jgi:hypothetical protein
MTPSSAPTSAAERPEFAQLQRPPPSLESCAPVGPASKQPSDWRLLPSVEPKEWRGQSGWSLIWLLLSILTLSILVIVAAT